MEHINRDENEQHNGQTHEEHLEGTLLPEDAGAPEEGHVDSGRLGRIKHQAKHTLDRAREGLSAGAATAAERGQQALGTVRERAGRTAEFVREAESDEQIRVSVTHRPETSLHRAGDALTKAAPSWVMRPLSIFEREVEMTGWLRELAIQLAGVSPLLQALVPME